MMKNTSVLAVVLSSVASFWLAGCAADSSSPTGDEEQSPVATPTGAATAGGAQPGSEFAKTAPELPEAKPVITKELTELRASEKVDPKAQLPQPIDQKYEDSACDVGGEVECSCGVCAPIWRCVAICETIPQ